VEGEQKVRSSEGRFPVDGCSSLTEVAAEGDKKVLKKMVLPRNLPKRFNKVSKSMIRACTKMLEWDKTKRHLKDSQLGIGKEEAFIPRKVGQTLV
jgi:hypothetical protein